MASKNKTLNITLSILLVAFLSLCFVYFFITTSFSNVLGEDEYYSYENWDGITVSETFSSGTGTEEAPYSITSGADLALLANKIQEEESYRAAHYQLNHNINMQNFTFVGIGSEEIPFAGTFDGNGYSVANINLTTEGKTAIGFFNHIENATIENLNLKQVTVNSTLEKTDAIGILTGVSSNSTIQNIGIYDSTIETITENISGMVAGKSDTSIYQTIVTRGDITENGIVKETLFGTSTNDEASTIVIYQKGENITLASLLDTLTISNVYTYRVEEENLLINTVTVNEDGTISLDVADQTLETLASMLTSSIDDRFAWRRDEDYIRFDQTTNVESTIQPLTIAPPEIATMTPHDTGIEGDTVYLNDLTADWNYYQGMNYTESDDETLPDGTNQEKYTEQTMIAVELNYHGSDVKGLNTGYVSLEEQQSNFVYYKWYPVNNNGTPNNMTDDYVEIELIDNPYADRPDNLAFNGWVTTTAGAVVEHHTDYYTRTVTVPVTYTNGIPNEQIIDLYASWTTAISSTMSGSNWDNAFRNLATAGMHTVSFDDFIVELPYYMEGYYIRVSVADGDSCTGLYDSRGEYQTNCTCNGFWGMSCTYYQDASDLAYSEDETYYQVSRRGSMSVVYPNITPDTEVVENPLKYSNMAGFFRQVSISYNQSMAGYYDSDGELQTGNCTSRWGCTAYELIPYQDGNDYVTGNTYYYLATRDTNIIVMNGNTSSEWDYDMTKPFTLTSLNNGVDYRSSATWTTSNTIGIAYADTRIEWVTISTSQNFSNSDPPSSASSRRMFYGNYQNVKFGRGISQVGNYTNFSSVIGGNNTSGTVGSRTNLTKYRLIIESGAYNNIVLTNGPMYSTRYNIYIAAQGVYGNDYDRATQNNDNLRVYFDTNGSWGGVYYGEDDASIIFDTTVKSGQFGTSRDDYTTGIYVGGRSYGEHHGLKRLKFEGGWVYNIIGGPISADDANVNDTYIQMSGGQADIIFGGAGTSATYGNRIIQVTGGQVNYSVFGGSNSYQGTSSEGTIIGDSLVYVGGDAIIGNENNLNGTLFGSEAGSVFGIGNGRSGMSSLGSNANSNIIIDGGTILRNVYGGGNYGAVGASSSSATTTTKIQVIDGTINGSVYGGGNNNGAGATNKRATVTIDMSGGTVNGNVYGGSRQTGTIYGNVNVNVTGGTVETSVYGGGEGGSTGWSSSGTFVTGNIYVTIGNRSLTTLPTINQNVYGGSAFGTVNGSSASSNLSSATTNVTVNCGTINGAVYGGGQGNETYTPYVLGNITVNINGGIINQVFGTNDAAGTPNGYARVYLNGGSIDKAFGGGNQADSRDTYIYLQGATVTEIYGGGNQAGADNTYVELSKGSVVDTYGGSNQSGDVASSNVVVQETKTENTQENVTVDVTLNKTPKSDWDQTDYASYIEGTIQILNNTSSNITDWTLTFDFPSADLDHNYSETEFVQNGNTITLTEANRYWGTNTVPANGSYTISQFGFSSYVSAEDFNLANVKLVATDEVGKTYEYTIDGLQVHTIYGGNNAGGTVTSSDIQITDSTVTNVYGGNNEDGTTGDTNIVVTGSTLDSIYGGGNLANTTGNTNLTLTNSTVSNAVYGGGNNAQVYGSTNLSASNLTAGNIFGGGNAGDVLNNSQVEVSGSTITGSIYGGGNSAAVLGDTVTTVAGTTTVGESVFGGGNSGAVGEQGVDASTTTVNILGASIAKNVYGGCNTSVVYGETYVNIGSSAAETDTLKRDNIEIDGTVFGGGEANASGSEDYDFTFISVTQGITIQIDGTDYTDRNFYLNGSIFGSGNASSSSGESKIYVTNLGTREHPNRAISIQRANLVDIDSSTIELVGTTDRTNEYSDILYSLNRIDHLIIRNNTTLLLQRNANLLQKFESLTKDGEKATVEITDDGTTTRNVDNRLYMIANRNLNITTNEQATAYGEVLGMTFFGMYNSYGNGSYSYGIYNMENNDAADAGDVIMGGSYVLGLHALNMDYYEDGFYTNYIDDEYTKVTTGYIIPTPESANYYMWTIGMDAINYSFTLTASKYASLGTYELSLIDFSAGNTIFNVVGFNAEGLTEGISLVDSNDVPKVGMTEEEANSVLGLSMKSETQEWTSSNTTKFLSENQGMFTGDDVYRTDNQATAPSLTFYLYHAKNISLEGELGTIVITLQAMVPKNEIEYDVQLITITIDLTARTYTDAASYDASITYGKKYEMPSATDVNITNRSQFTAYYSLYYDAQTPADIYGPDENYHRVLTSNFALPENTKITMIDLGSDQVNPKYYYYTVTAQGYNEMVTELQTEGEASIPLSKFIAMDSTSTNNTYDDVAENQNYFHNTLHAVMEEFLFIVDFYDTTITGTHQNNAFIMELRTDEDRTSISVLGIRQNLMQYNLYDSSNAVLEADMQMDNNYFYAESNKAINYNIHVGYNLTGNLQSIIDTNYESSSMGINITLQDATGNIVSSSMLVGTSITIDNVQNYPSSDGIFRIKLSDKVSNLSKVLNFYTGNMLPAGVYTMKIELFSSSDGLHMTGAPDHTDEVTITVIGQGNAIVSNILDTAKLVDGTTGLTQDGTNTIMTTLNYESVLVNPNIRLVVYRRNTSSYQDTEYTEIPLAELFKDNLQTVQDYGLQTTHTYEYIVTSSPRDGFQITHELQDALTSGTYKLVYGLYDNNQLIDSDTEYIIIKK